MASAARRTDQGVSLVELILAVALLGTMAVTILAAFGTLIKASDTGRKSGDLSTTMAAVAEATVDNSRNPYVNTCAARYNPVAGLDDKLPKTISVGSITVEEVRYWDGVAFVPEGSCSDLMLAVPYWHLQEIRLRVATTDGKFTRSITVVKRG